MVIYRILELQKFNTLEGGWSNVNNPIRAVVQKVVAGENPYVVTKPIGPPELVSGISGSITFSLTEEVWTESIPPEKGALVMLTDYFQKGQGWRASKANFVSPESSPKS